MKLAWTPEARADRRSIYDTIETDNPRAAVAIDELFAEQGGNLTDNPKIGRIGREEGTRELIVHRNYILVYEIADATIRVLRVLHAARQWPR